MSVGSDCMLALDQSNLPTLIKHASAVGGHKFSFAGHGCATHGRQALIGTVNKYVDGTARRHAVDVAESEAMLRSHARLARRQIREREIFEFRE